MIQAKYNDKALVVDILTQAFDSNKSVNYVVKQDKKRNTRIRILMEYSFELCWEFGEIYLADDKKGVALILYPHTKKTTLNAIGQDLKLAFCSIGITRIFKVLERESQIKKFYPTKLMYLWFLGVDPLYQGNGKGSKLLKEIIDLANRNKLPLYLETSTEKNLPLYNRNYLQIYNELDFNYPLYMFKKEPEYVI